MGLVRPGTKSRSHCCHCRERPRLIAGRWTKYVSGEGRQCRPCHHCDWGNQHALDFVVRWASTKHFMERYFMYHTWNLTWKAKDWCQINWTLQKIHFVLLQSSLSLYSPSWRMPVVTRHGEQSCYQVPLMLRARTYHLNTTFNQMNIPVNMCRY